MAHGITLELRDIPGPSHDPIPGTECSLILRKVPGHEEPVPVGVKRCMPYVVEHGWPMRDRALRGKARIRARRAARKAAVA